MRDATKTRGMTRALPALLLWSAAAVANALTPTPTPTPRVGLAPCAADCDGNRVVDVAEVTRCVNVAIGGGNTCARCDADADGGVHVNDIVAAVSAVLNGCGSGDRYEPDDSRAAAQPIACGELQAHDLGEVGDEDWVQIQLPANQGGALSTESIDGNYWYVATQLYTRDGNVAAYGGPGYARVDFGCPANAAPTTYYARMFHFFSSDQAGSYGVRLSCVSCPTATPTYSPTPTVGPDPYEPDDTVYEASAIGCGEVQHRTAESGDVDWVSLQLDTRSTVRMHRVQFGPLGGWTVFDSNGNALPDLSYSYTDRRFECGTNALEPGRYDMRIDSEYYYSSVYDLAVLCEPCDAPNPTATPTWTPTPTATPIPPDPYETDGRDSAVPIACGEGIIRSLAPTGDSDWLMLQVPSRSAVHIQPFSYGPSIQLALQDSTGLDIGANSYASLDRLCGESALDPGTYFVEIYADSYNGLGVYDVLVTCLPCDAAAPPTPTFPTRTPTQTPLPPDAYEPDDTAAQARAIACGELQVRSRSSAYDEDWASVELTAPSALSIAFSGNDAIELLDADGRNVEQGYRGNLERTCGEQPAVGPGRYLIHVPRSYYNPLPSYNLSLLCAPCPATPTPTPTPTRRPTGTPRPSHTPGPGQMVRAFHVAAGVLLADPSSTTTGLFTTGLSGANAAESFGGDPLMLQLGGRDANGVASLRLAADATIRVEILDGSHLCMQFLSAGSDGSIDCDGGTAYGTRGRQPAGDVGVPFTIDTALGEPSGPGNGNLLVPVRFQFVPIASPDFDRPCADVTYTNPIQIYAFSTQRATAQKGSLTLEVAGAPFDCDSFDVCSGAQLAAGSPATQQPVGDVANVFRLADDCE